MCHFRHDSQKGRANARRQDCIFHFLHARPFQWLSLIHIYLIQTVYAADECNCSVDDLKVGCYVRVTGLLREEPRAVYGIEPVSYTQLDVYKRQARSISASASLTASHHWRGVLSAAAFKP